MYRVLLVQLPIPRLNFGQITGNIPLGGACLKEAVSDLSRVDVELLPESVVSYLSDGALEDRVCRINPDVVGFSVFSWNLDRSLYLAEKLKQGTGCRIVFGGPEITPDNDQVRSKGVDFHVFGEGEAVFRRLLSEPDFWNEKTASENAGPLFQNAKNPYLMVFLEPDLEDILLVETQRGCPYRCTFCYYNKSHKRTSFKEAAHLLPVFQWGIRRGISEIYLLDPSLNVRPRLDAFLREIASINPDRKTGFFSEIRAETVDDKRADLFFKAGFTGFEIGLQSTNENALSLVNRRTDMNRFLKGAEALLKKEISLSLDLIAGLPGDDLKGFMRSVDFAAAHGLGRDVQIFPLSVLPGTRMRRDARKLGLRFEPHPPYTVIETPTFSREDLLLAYDYAETRLDTAFFPMPDLEIAFRKSDSRGFPKEDIGATLGRRRYVAKVVLFEMRPMAELQGVSRRLTQPYQVLVGPTVSGSEYLTNVLRILTSENPFTPFEIVFFEPETAPDIAPLMDAVRLFRPHFLDGDLRYLYPKPGNRAVLLTLVSAEKRVRFEGEMKRRIFWWKNDRLPEEAELKDLEDWDGIFIDSPVSRKAAASWQDTIGRKAEEDHLIGFSKIRLQQRWLLLTNPGKYAASILKEMG